MKEGKEKAEKKSQGVERKLKILAKGTGSGVRG